MTDQPPAEDERTEPPADVLGDGPPLAAETGRSRRRGLVFGAAATVLALVAAGGVVLSVRLAGGGRQPESLAPRSTFAFVKVDLDPAANQKLAIRDFSSKFPDAPKAQAEDIIERLIAEALENDDDVKFDQDIKPWLGRRAAIAGFADSAGKPQVIAIVQSDDDAEAKRSLQRIADREREAGDRPAYAVHKGYVVFAEEQSVADQAVRDAEAAALPENKTFRSDVEELDGDQVVVGWVDVEAAYAAARRENPRWTTYHRRWPSS